MQMSLTIATRGSKLALWQAHHIKGLLEARHPGLGVQLLILKTQGDKILDVPLAKVGGKGLFVKEIEEALADGRADLAVHSMKDVPVERRPGLVLGPIPRREDLADALLATQYPSLEALPRRAVVGTSSLRRQAQLLALRPDLEIRMLRGNLDTRVGKLLDGQFDAIVVAAAGLNRLGLTAPHNVRLGPPDFLPAVAQGALGLEFRADDAKTRDLTAFLDHPDTRDAVDAERAFLARLEGGCQVPIAAHGRLEGDQVALTGLVADPDGKRPVRAERRAPRGQAMELGRLVAEDVLAQGGGDILRAVYGQGKA
ncbi:hydroxymethylbilane synthase [Fundidesulfovibrio magnetotacticus]|uniref:hydroxymethylbilane synthase n=1 Tax=Fundidesulfovibrio magnetotacticus TaxID=2730080 RepID=UPI00156607F5|nr:hydroxymethylbilane synthase [Fundidesulfovibrio magnetotacticus]